MHPLHVDGLVIVLLLFGEVGLEFIEDGLEDEQKDDDHSQDNVHEVVVHQKLVFESYLADRFRYGVHSVVFVAFQAVVAVGVAAWGDEYMRF